LFFYIYIMGKLDALQFLISAPSKSAVEKLVVLVFERARGGSFTPEELAVLAKKFSLEEEQLVALLGALRLVIRTSLKPGVTLEQVGEALPESVDKRLRVLVLKIIAAHIDGWREELGGGAAPESPATSPEATPVKSKKSARESEPEPKAEPEPPRQEEPVLPPVLPPVEAAPEDSSSVPPPVMPPVLPAPEESTPTPRKKKAVKKEADLEAVGVQQSVPTATRKLGPSLPRFEGIDWRVDVRSASDTVSRMSVPTVLVQMRVQNSYNGEVPPAEGQAVAQRLVTFELNKETLATMLDGLVFVRDQLASIAQ